MSAEQGKSDKGCVEAFQDDLRILIEYLDYDTRISIRMYELFS